MISQRQTGGIFGPTSILPPPFPHLSWILHHLLYSANEEIARFKTNCKESAVSHQLRMIDLWKELHLQIFQIHTTHTHTHICLVLCFGICLFSLTFILDGNLDAANWRYSLTLTRGFLYENVDSFLCPLFFFIQ